MSPTEYCPDCNEAVLWKCGGCEKENDRSVHTYHPEKQESSRTASAVVGALVSLVSGVVVMVPM